MALDDQDTPEFAADLGGLSFDQANVDRAMGLQTRATRQQELENERRRREQEQLQKEQEKLNQKTQNAGAEALMRSTGQEFYTDPFGNLQPIRDPQSGKPVFKEQDRVDYQEDGTPVRRQVDREGKISFSNPDKDAPVGPAENDPGTLYKQNKYQPWEPVGNAYDISKEEGHDQATADAAKKIADKGQDKLRSATEEGIGKIKAQATLDVATHAQREQELTGKINALTSEADALEQNPIIKQKEGGFLGIGAKPTAEASVLKTQLDAKRSQISQLETERASVAGNRLKAEADEKRTKLEADLLEATNKLQGYEATETARRNTLLKAGKSPEEIAADPLISSIAKKKEEVGLTKSRHERQNSILQAAGEQAARAFAVDPPSQDDLLSLDNDFNAKRATFDTIKGQIAAEQKRIADGNYTSRDEVKAANERIAKLNDQMDAATANVNASLEVRNRAAQAFKNFNGQAKPGTRSIQVAVGPDFQLSFKDERTIDPNQPTPVITTPAPQNPNTPETPEQKAAREKSQLLSRLTTAAALRESSVRPTSLAAQIKKYTIGDNTPDQLASMALEADDELARQSTAGSSQLPEALRSAPIDKDTWATMSTGEKKSYLADRMGRMGEADKKKVADAWFAKEFDAATQGIPEADRAKLKDDVENINKLNLDKKLPGVVLSGGQVRVNPRLEHNEQETNSALDSMLKQGQISQAQADAAKTAYAGVRKTAEEQTKQAILQSEHFQKFASSDPKIGTLSPDDQIAAYNKKYSGPWTAASEALIGAVEGAKQNYIGAWQGAKLLRAAQTGTEEQRMSATLKVLEEITKDQEADQKGQSMSETAQGARGVGNTFGQMAAQVLPAVLAGLFTKGRGAGVAEAGNISIQSLTNAAQYALQGYQDTANQGAKNAGYQSIQDLAKADPKLAQQIHEAAVRSMADNIKISPNEMIPVEKMVKPIEKLGATRWGRMVDRMLVNPGTESLQEFLSQYAQSSLTNIALGDNSTPVNSITADQAGQIFLGSALLSVPVGVVQQRIQNRQVGQLAQDAQTANQNYAKAGGSEALIKELSGTYASMPTATPPAMVPQSEQYKADAQIAQTLTAQQQPGEAEIRPEHIQEARSLAPIDSQTSVQETQQRLSDLDASVENARQAYEQASQSKGLLSGVNFEAQAKAAEQLATAVNQRAQFLASLPSLAAEAQQRSLDTIKAAREILSNPDPQARAVASGILKIANGQGINLLTGSERDLLIRPQEKTVVDPATGAPVKQTIPPMIRMEKGTPVVTDEAIRWLSENGFPITEGLVPLDETGQLRQIELKEKQNAQQPGTPVGGVATPGVGGSTSQPETQPGLSPEADRGRGDSGSGSPAQGGNAGTGILSPLFAPFSQRVAERRAANALRRSPALPATTAREAKSLIENLGRIAGSTGLKTKAVSAKVAGASGVSVTASDDGEIVLQFNLATLAKNAANTTGSNTTEGTASEWIHSALGEEGLHFGWFAHLKDQWSELPQDQRGGFKNYIRQETMKRFAGLRENLSKIRNTQAGAELGAAVVAAYNNYYGEADSSVQITPETASGRAMEILDRLSKASPSEAQNAYAFMNELGRSLAQMRTEGRVTENADATGFIEAVLKYIREALNALRKVAENTQKYDPSLDEMVSAMENRYAEVNALLNGSGNPSETAESTENRQTGAVSAQEVPVVARLQRENAKLKGIVEEQKSKEERVAKRRGTAAQAAQAVNPQNMKGVQLGKPVVVVGANNEKIPGRYVSLPPGVVQTSHLPGEGFRKNPNYGGENTRPYDSDATEQQKVRNIALPGAMIPESIVNNGPSAADGPPQIVRVTFTTPDGETKTVLQTAGGNGREMGINLAEQEDQDRLAQATQDNAAIFGLEGMPEGNRIYRFLGDFDLRDSAQARQYQQLVDKLNPAPGKVQGTTQRAKIDANLNVSPEVIGRLSMDIQPSDAQAALREIINSPNSGVDRNLMEATAADPIQSQQYIQQLVIQRGLNSDSLNAIYFDTRPDTKEQPARSTMRSLIAGGAELGVKLRNSGKPAVADALAAAIENINGNLLKGKSLKGAIAQVASQQESDILAQGGAQKGSGQANTASADVQTIARALMANVVTDKGGERVNAPVTQENFKILMDQISGAVASYSEDAELFGPPPSVSELIQAAIDANNRLRQKEATDGEIAVAARPTMVDNVVDEGTQERRAIQGNGIDSNAGRNRGDRAAYQGVGQEGVRNPSQGQPGESGSNRLNAERAERISPPRIVDDRNIDERLAQAFQYTKDVYFDALGMPQYKIAKGIPEELTQETLYKKEAVVKKGSPLNTIIGLPPGPISRAKMRNAIFDYFLKGGREKMRLANVTKPKHKRHPEMLFLGGGGGSGKSSILKIVQKDYKFNSDGYVVANPDEVREFIPEYEELNKYHHRGSAAITHEEASLIAKRVESEAMWNRYPIVVDGTLANKEKALARFAAARIKGYQPVLLGITIDPHEAMVRASIRGKTSGRFVPTNVLLEAHKGFNSAVSEYVKDFLKHGDAIRIFDNTPPKATELPLDQVMNGVNPYITPRTKINTDPQSLDEFISSYGQSLIRNGEVVVQARKSRFQDDLTGDLFSVGNTQTETAPLTPQEQGPNLNQEASTNEQQRTRTPAEANLELFGDRGESAQGEAGYRPASAPSTEGEVSGRVSAPGLQRERNGQQYQDGVDAKLVRVIPENPSDRNFSIRDIDSIAPATNGEKWDANIEAIRLLRVLQSEGRNATPEEKAVLAKYTGWGWAKEAFNQDNERWAKRYSELREILGEDEFMAARKSSLNAHYTSPEIIRSMWKIADRLGFKGGRVLEPAGGVGHFFGMMPEEILNSSKLYGVELDKISGEIFKLLYPEAEVQITGFQEAGIPNNSMDLAISNVPFGNYKVAGAKDYPNLLIHDYFFARSLDKVKPGGLVMFITSDGTMDKADRRTRDLLTSKADLVGAIRLPNDAFKGNAGTEVTTDIIILRKKDGTPFKGENWSALQTVGSETIEERQPNGMTKDVEKDIMVNQYFASHPEMALGTHTLQGTMYGSGDYALKSNPGQDTQSLMTQAINALPENIMNQKAAQAEVSMDSGLADEGTKDGSYVFKDGAFYQVVDKRLTRAPWLDIRNFGTLVTPEQKAKNELKGDTKRSYDDPITDKERETRIEIATDWLGLREAAVDLINSEVSPGIEETVLEAKRLKLNKAYDAYIKKWGTLTKSSRHLEKAAFLEDDPEYTLLQALEDEKREIGAKGNESKTIWKKADIFTKRIRQPRARPESASNINDAINAVLNFDGMITKKGVAELLGISEEEATRQIVESGRAFLNPTSGLLETSEKYLSGNVRKKLQEATEAAKTDPSLAANVEALKNAMPKDRQLGEIYFELASRWIPSEVTSKFASALFGTTAKVEYRQAMNKFSVVLGNPGTAENITTYGTKDLLGRDILIHALNGTEPTITRTITDGFGNKKTEQDQEATQEARRKLRSIQQKFQSWVKTNTDTVSDGTSTQEAMEKAYNETNNSVVPPSYSGDYLVKDPSNKKNPDHNIPGLSNTVWMNGHRRSVVARILQEGSAMMAHGVGSGKTFSQIVAAMEMKRLGLAKKPMIVVQKATVGQFAKSVREAYPNARILVATEKTFASVNRRRFMSRIATGDYDMVIVTQPQFDMILPGEENVRQYFNGRIAELEQMKREQAALKEEETGRRGRAGKTNDIETAIERLRAKMEKMLGGLKERGDNNISFEQLGVDALFIDEAHAYKKTSLATNMRRVKGVPNDESQRAMGLEMKAEFIQRTNNGRNVILATGTPITNSMAEVYVMLKLATPHVLKEYNIGNFDDFARTFGKIVTDLEYTWGAKWKMVTRFKKFVNGNELVAMIRSGFDVKMGNKELGLNVPVQRGDNGEDAAQLKVLPPTDAMIQISDWITSIADEYERVMKTGSADEKKMAAAIPIVTMQAGMAAALDPRLVDPTLPDDPNSKVNTAVRRVKEIYDESSDHNGAIVIFADRFKPMNTTLLQNFVNGMTGSINVEEGEETATEEQDNFNKKKRKNQSEDEEEQSELSKKEDEDFKSAGFNLYYDLKNKLIAQGIPADQVAIVHEYNTDKRRADLFAAVNSGKVRVVIGSTEKLGVGVNMQERLVAAIHLDPPRMMTPAMVEQRIGRIIRQLNGYAEPDKEGSPLWGGGVYNIYYGVERSMDTGVYQMLENKGRAMAQALSGVGIGREFDDPSDELTQSMAMMKAISTGDTRVIRMAELKQKMDELETEKSAFDNAKTYTAKRLAETRQIISQTEQLIPLQAKDMEVFQANFQKGGEMPGFVVGGETIGEFKDAVEALRQMQSRLAGAALRSADNIAREKTTLGGVPVTFEVKLTLDGKDIQDQRAIIYSPTNPGVELGTRRWESNEGVIQAIRNFATGFQKVIDDTQAKLGSLNSQVTAMMGEMNAVWDRQDEYNQVSKELEGIQKSLVKEAKANETNILENAPPGGFTEADKVPAPQKSTLESKRQAFAEAGKRLNSLEEGTPEYQQALEAFQAAREDLADARIGRREEEVEPTPAPAPGSLEALIQEGESVVAAATAKENIARIQEQMKTGQMPLIAGRNAIKEELKKLVAAKSQDPALISEGEMPFNLSGQVDSKSLTPEEQRIKERSDAQGEANQKAQGDLFARAPRFASITPEVQRYIDDAFASLDEDSMLEQQDKAETEKGGQRTIGRPDLALGSLNTQIMGVDAYRERIATPETQQQWSDEAQKMLQKDYSGTRNRLIEAGMTGGTLSPVETKAAMMIVAKETLEAAKDPSKRAEVAKLIYAYRETGREEARALSARRDPFMSKSDRHREFLAKMIFAPSVQDRAAIENISDPKMKGAAISAAADKRVAEIEKALKAMGVSFDDILKGEVEISLIKSRVVENTLKAFNSKEQEALRMIQNIGPEYAKIATALGFSVGQVKNLHKEAIDSIRRRHFEKVKKGLTVDDLKKDSASVFARKPRTLTDAEAEEEFAKIIDALGFGMEKKTKAKKAFQLEDPIEVIKIARTIAATDKGAMDMVHEYWMASLLSGLTTHAANIAGNTVNAALDLTFQRGMETLVNAVVGDKDSARAGEFKYLMGGMKGALSAAFRAGIRAYDAEQSMVDYDLLGHEIELGQGGFVPGSNTGAAIKGLKGRIVRTPLRALQFMDDFSKTIVARMEVGAQAYRIGKANGYDGQALSDFISDEVNTIGSQSWERAVGRATTLAFQDKIRSLQEGGNLIEGGAYALNKGLQHYKPGKFFVPFIGTVYNIFRTGVRKTPVGSATMLYKLAREGYYSIQGGRLNPHPYAKSEFIRDTAEQIMAWALTAMLWSVAPGDDDDDQKSILITGSEPFQKGQTGMRDLNQRMGLAPYHIRMGDKSFNYGRIEPIATVLGTTIDLIKTGKMVRDQREAGDILGYASSRILGQIVDKTYGRGMSDIAGFVQDPKSASQWIVNLASTFVPNILRQPMRAMDPYVRETSIETSPKEFTKGIAQKFMQSAVPMGSVNQPRVDLYGKPIMKEGNTFTRLLAPAQVGDTPTTIQKADKLLAAWNKKHPSDSYAPGRPSRRYADPVTGEVKYMDDKTFRKFSERAGQIFASTSSAAITPSMIKNPTEENKEMVQKLVTKARKEARKEVLATSARKERSLKEILFGS